MPTMPRTTPRAASIASKYSAQGPRPRPTGTADYSNGPCGSRVQLMRGRVHLVRSEKLLRRSAIEMQADPRLCPGAQWSPVRTVLWLLIASFQRVGYTCFSSFSVEHGTSLVHSATLASIAVRGAVRVTNLVFLSSRTQMWLLLLCWPRSMHPQPLFVTRLLSLLVLWLLPCRYLLSPVCRPILGLLCVTMFC